MHSHATCDETCIMEVQPRTAKDDARVNLGKTRLGRFTRGRSAKTTADQLIVSASNFLTGIILVRGLGLVDFGKFTVAYVLLLLANSIQLSFISSPMITLGSLCSSGNERNRFVRGVFGVQLAFCAIATFATVAAVIIYLAIDRTSMPLGSIRSTDTPPMFSASGRAGAPDLSASRSTSASSPARNATPVNRVRGPRRRIAHGPPAWLPRR